MNSANRREMQVYCLTLVAHRHYEDLLKRVSATRLFHCDVDPSDIVQEAFASVLESIDKDSLKSTDRDEIYAVLAAAARFRSIDARRSYARRRNSVRCFRETDASSLVCNEAPTEECAAVRDEVGHFSRRLSGFSRQILDMRIHDYTFEEIASKHACGHQTIRRRVYRMRKMWTARDAH